MGYSISWLAARMPAETVWELLGIRPTGEESEFPEAPLVGAQLSTGWYVVVANRCDARLVAEPTLTLVSKGADVIACTIEEHVMQSLSSLWSDGKPVWSVLHDAQRSIEHLDASGHLPALYSDVRDRLFAQQSSEGGVEPDVDFVFDVPLEIAQQITGFKHDAPGEPERFTILEPLGHSTLAGARRWWKFW